MFRPLTQLPSVFQIWIRTHRIHMFLGLPAPDPLVTGMDPDPETDPLVRGIDPRIRIHMSWIRNTGYNYIVYILTWACPASPQGSQWGPFPLRRCRLRHRGARKHRNRTRYRKHFVPETPSGKPTKILFMMSIFWTRCLEKIRRVEVPEVVFCQETNLLFLQPEHMLLQAKCTPMPSILTRGSYFLLHVLYGILEIHF